MQAMSSSFFGGGCITNLCINMCAGPCKQVLLQRLAYMQASLWEGFQGRLSS